MNCAQGHYKSLYWIRANQKLNLPRLMELGATVIEKTSQVVWPVEDSGFQTDEQSVRNYFRCNQLALERWLHSPSYWAWEQVFTGQQCRYPGVVSDFNSEYGNPRSAMCWIVENLRSVDARLTDKYQLFQDPVRAVIRGAELLHMYPSEGRQSSRISEAALLLIGLGSMALNLTTRCRHCFRFAIFGFELCCAHSQSKFFSVGPFNPGEKYVQARRARKLFRAIDLQIGGFPPSPMLFEIVHSLLHKLDGGAAEKWNLEVKQSLRASELVTKLLPEDFDLFDTSTKLDVLRESIDPFEFLPHRWPAKILLAERWFEADAQLPRQLHGSRLKTRQLHQSAVQMLAQGVRHSDVAARLEISRSYLSHLLSRSLNDSQESR